MAKLYIGDSQGTPAIIKIEEVPKKKYGVSIDNLLGDVDKNGTYVVPTEKFTVDITGVKKAGYEAFRYFFAYNKGIQRFTADSVVEVAGNAFEGAFANSTIVSASFGGIERIAAPEVFFKAFSTNSLESVVFSKLKTINGSNVFNVAFGGGSSNIEGLDSVFPALEEVSGNSALTMCYNFGGKITTLSFIKKIVGSSSSFLSTFGSPYMENTIFLLPRATELSRYIWNISASYPGEVHFAAANQAAIEACEGYSYKWGFVGATIYFDLMLSITVNGVVYSREHTIGGYTSWKDASDNIVYTDATAEPAVGTPVYSDQGTTQVGTVSEVA